jgi:hypothetical protein
MGYNILRSPGYVWNTTWLSGSGPLANVGRALRQSDRSTLIWLEKVLASAIFDL